MVGISPATRHATPDQPMGVPPPPRLWDHAYRRWHRRGRHWRIHTLVRRLRMDSLLPGSWGAESRGWLLVPHYRSFRVSPNLSLVNTRRGGDAVLAAHGPILTCRGCARVRFERRDNGLSERPLTRRGRRCSFSSRPLSSFLTTKYGAFMEPRGCNRWQSAANQLTAGAAEQAKTVAVDCDQVPKGSAW